MPSFQTASACRDRTPRGVGGSGVWRPRAGLPQSLRGKADLQLGLVPQLVQPGRDGSARAGACSAYESDSAGVLAALPSQAIGKHLATAEQARRVALEFMPMRNSKPIGSRGLSVDDAERLEIGDEQGVDRRAAAVPHCCRCAHQTDRRPRAGAASADRREPGSAEGACPPVKSAQPVRGRLPPTRRANITAHPTNGTAGAV